ncbi:MAG: L,D-transpeptidase family protein [Actinobacteria bacterium]|nr:L,D-transpeptidase family protein [Actinomycetota bacterium]
MTGRHLLRSRRGGLLVTGVCGALALLATACSGSSSSNTAQHGSGNGGTTTVANSGPQVAITPANGSRNVKTGRGVSVTVAHGKIENVSVTAGHAHANGTLQGQTAWHTVWPLHAATRYKVTVTAKGTDGKTTTTTSTFKTQRPAGTFTASTILGNGTYGVGIPIMINFSQEVAPKYRAGIEKAINITSSKPVVGAWYWDGGQTLDFRTRNYWPQYTKVSFDAHFNGAQIAPGVFGTANLTQSFRIGKSLIGVTSTRTHHTKIYWGHKLYATWADSTGMPGDDTANGTYLTIEKGNPVKMSGPGYKNVPVYWSVRFTWSGNYYHSAPWSVGEQGFTNVSHGCVNLSPQNAEWWYLRSNPGDPITITGSPAAGRWDDGYTEWFLTWKQLLRGSATHQAVQVGPTGSSFVSPDTLPATTSDSRLHGSKPHNYLAS